MDRSIHHDGLSAVPPLVRPVVVPVTTRRQINRPLLRALFRHGSYQESRAEHILIRNIYDFRARHPSSVDDFSPLERGKGLDGFPYLLLGQPQVVKAL